jgi:cupin fold WbuC family metalloprotein
MKETGIPELSTTEIHEYIQKAASSKRRRYPRILHNPGDEFNRVINFMMEDSYMQPHLHPGKEKIEKMYLVQGKFAVLFFSEKGEMDQSVVLEKGKTEYIEIPAFTWHTYVMLSETVVSYETMMGKYDPETWKTLAEWAPTEDTNKSITYLNELKQKVKD